MIQTPAQPQSATLRKFMQAFLCAVLSVNIAIPVQAADAPKAPAGKVDGQYIQANAAHTREWPSYGLDYAETRFS